ncbi:tryptophan--tRNA ligase [Paenibacillus sp. R14(2021)]|uniref:tryptophan--tRNA ligase n=1 Tax=Paenibacillus sp. R14(2021) TaxID=2859228 RepID=UPI001C612A33|nr:tryptophan--tRNA ligase [Paenibacillus sp. R14(2021)]
MKIVLSGIKPSGELNIGGYGGALHQFLALQQQQFECLFFVPDLHAVTVAQDPNVLRKRTMDIAAYYIAAGIDPKKATIFIQSHVSAHAELGWLMETQAHFGELSRMTQFKEKSNGKDTVSSALFTYPVLMAADILLYQATHVPVGDDQKQHLEMTRDLAARFNQRFRPVFTVPEPIIQQLGSRIMSLDDPAKKMSKSNPNANSYILFQDSPEVIHKKIAKAVTDSEGVVRCDWAHKPAVSNLIEIYAVFADESVETIESRYKGVGYGAFKRDLADVIAAKLQPIQRRYSEIVESDELIRILKDGAVKAAETANRTLLQAKQAMGFVTWAQ